MIYFASDFHLGVAGRSSSEERERLIVEWLDEVSRDGESIMTVYNDVMTVTELVNLVAFLETRYEELERPGYRYTTYSMSE